MDLSELIQIYKSMFKPNSPKSKLNKNYGFIFFLFDSDYFFEPGDDIYITIGTNNIKPMSELEKKIIHVANITNFKYEHVFNKLYSYL